MKKVAEIAEHSTQPARFPLVTYISQPYCIYLWQPLSRINTFFCYWHLLIVLSIFYLP